ncbi:SMI1/KNR4 family protein [Bacillus haynesii]|uniref:SMI1/KNR4 family protein n=1 Tax=Bacillus TaxID=1386 RepID=UPI0013EEEAF4|nr:MULTISPECIES: SMI1/KNR4 family protein [Bacillus]WIY56436.1 SMI1/KNR4 family protein [Bacillus licheniformis]MCY7799788.1 SMI1/KNR4 family protein [Bacillus haynesii]MCY7837165.1 SMI1/KNR4 family protein [Bacillus haynesii]MCY7844192.1 SMI1/KNR4 family protein [Bacillus haynesii]MCY7966837.1 SMI1/KNR4 family protein [Bacillus haynesii]
MNILKKIEELYQEDYKKLRTGTILYGNVNDGIWHTTIHVPLDRDELKELNYGISDIQGQLPASYQNFLMETNGAYLFDLIHITGKSRNQKGMSHEERIHEPRYLEEFLKDFTLSKKNKPLLEKYFFFAESYVNGTVYAFDEDEHVVEFTDGRYKKIREFEDLDALLDRVFEVGSEHYRHKSFIEF